jgi:primosomal protein N' (replication factor Y)
LNVPDFRASERTFQLLTQVAGRAGRGSLPGKVIIQTFNPQQHSVQMAQEQNFISFYQQEAKFRQEMAYPPFTRLINFRMEGNTEAKTLRYAKMMEQMVCRILQQNKKFQGQVEVLGPALAPLARLRGKCRCQMLLKGKKWSILHHFAEQVLEKADEVSIPGVKLIVDVDPVNML